MRVTLLTVAAMCAFAANSILCRLALGERSIDPASFSAVRLASGALVLALLASLGRSPRQALRGSWVSAGFLFLYAVPFSFAYVSIETGTGALILFGAVQATMLTAGIRGGERVTLGQTLGLVSAGLGLVYLMSPGLAAPSPIGSTLMVVAGVAWGLYSLRGRGAPDALAQTTGNFIRSVPYVALVLVLALVMRVLPQPAITLRGSALAVASGAVASGLGYAVWYAALADLTATRAATVQLSVPILAAVGGAVFMGEAMTLRLLVSFVLVIGGIATSLRASRTVAPRPTTGRQ